MKIQRQCHALADALTDAVREKLRDRVELYCTSHEKTRCNKNLKDEELNTDEHDNTVLVGGSLSGDRTNVSKCLVGEGIDVKVGEGSIVIGCVFSRLQLCSTQDEVVKELHERHTVEIGKNCILIGCLFRDDVTIGENTIMAASGASQVTLGKDSRLFMSSVLNRYGTIGERFTAIQTIFHTDKCEVGTDAFMCSGKWGIISWGTAYRGLEKEMIDRCSSITYDLLIMRFLDVCWDSGLRFYDEQKYKEEKAEEEPDNWEYKYAHPTVYRRQYLRLDNMARHFALSDNIVEMLYEGATIENSTFSPMVVILRDYITDARASEEVQNFDGRKFTNREAYSYFPRIRVGNNLQVFSTFPLRVTRIEQEPYSRHWSDRPQVKPQGFGTFTWEKLGGHEYDLEIGDNCVITTSGDWITSKRPYRCECAGRFIMKDDVTFYVGAEPYGEPAIKEQLQSVDVFGDRSRSEHLSVQTEYLFDDRSTVFLRGTITGRQDNTPCHVWRLKVRRNDTAII
jgi:hypothetical protein